VQLNFERQNVQILKLGECGPNNGFAGGFDLNLIGIEPKTTALVVFFKSIFVAINAEQYLMCRDIKVLSCTAKWARAKRTLCAKVCDLAALKVGPSQIVHQGLHQNADLLLRPTALQNLSAVLPLKLDPKSGCTQHTQANGNAHH
jgi:hypothetical protein